MKPEIKTVNNENNTPEAQVDENELIRQRREKLTAWRESTSAYPNTFKPENLAQELIEQYGETEKHSKQKETHQVVESKKE